MTFSRRSFLHSGVQALGAASLLVSVPALAAGKDQKGRVSARDIKVKDVAGLALIDGAGCNVVALGGPDGALLIDGGLEANSTTLLKAVSAATKSARVNTLINTHWHPEQTGSNEAVGKTGGTLIAHEVTRLALTRAEQSPLFDGSYGPLPDTARPTKTTYNTGALQFGGEQVDYRYLPAAHTNGDLYVHFPKRNVLVAGGPVVGGAWPVIDYVNGGFMHGFLRSYEIMSELVQPDTIVIGANGSPLTGKDIVRHKDIYWGLFKQFFIFFNKGYGPLDVVAERPLKDYEAEMGDPARFIEYAYHSTQLATIPH
jgi:glyoxylase-like metal-dependent hydrolase (beta-lactamase superfamily II)